MTKTGKPRYYCPREQKDEPVEEIPAGYEIEESVNAIVSLVKTRPAIDPSGGNCQRGSRVEEAPHSKKLSFGNQK